ncbi:hypothetical protein ACTMS0_22380 [Micromonospora sp. H33]|uniref:hypothetical protein n=1 Tax=Micromonospora sp. H33 TaxID=3452215 RepID=UPI003F8AD7F0
MRLSRIIMALTVGLAVAVVPTAAGAAQPQPAPTVTQYPPGDHAHLDVHPPTIKIGGSVLLLGRNWTPGANITIAVSCSPRATAMSGARRADGERVAMVPVSFARQPVTDQIQVTADENGRFSVNYTPRHPGRCFFTATGGGESDTASVTILPKKKKHDKKDDKKDDDKKHLPVTGASTSTPMKVGGGLVGVGAVLLLMTFAWRQRHRLGARSMR